MFQFTALAAIRLWIQRMLIRRSRDQRSFVNSPELFADFHVLHRLLTPRHPPCALSSLTTLIQSSPRHNRLLAKPPVRQKPQIPADDYWIHSNPRPKSKAAQTQVTIDPSGPPPKTPHCWSSSPAARHLKLRAVRTPLIHRGASSTADKGNSLLLRCHFYHN